MFFRILPRLQVSKICTAVIILLLMVFLYNWKLKSDETKSEEEYNIFPFNVKTHEQMIELFYKQRQDWNVSKLGGILFMNKALPKVTEVNSKIYTIYIYRLQYNLSKYSRLRNSGSSDHLLDGCSVKNCIFQSKDRYLYIADAVVVNSELRYIPDVITRNRSQIWIFVQDSSPRSRSINKNKNTLSYFYDVFNWSMSYRHDADIPIPYGRTIGLNAAKLNDNESITSLIPFWPEKKWDVFVGIIIDECGAKYHIIDMIMNYLPIDVFGTCTKFYNENLQKRCPGKMKANCKELSKYLFYFVIEKSKCRDFITEKVFYHAYSKGAIPVIQGPSYEDCEKMLPPNSFLHTEKFKTAESIANEIIKISKNKKRLLSYHMWRNHFEVVNEHGYFGTKSYSWCRLCEAMTYNDKRYSVYNARDIRRFLNKETVCRKLVWPKY